MNEYGMLALEFIQISRTLKGNMTQPLDNCNRAWKRRATDKVFQGLEYDCSVSRFSTNFEKLLTRKEVQIKVVRRRLLRKKGENCHLKFSWGRECEDLPLISF